ncbi:MAG: Crp/Fnr family transcriptional regulator [Myxococcales bacterium]|jgi:CRP-like cAMP-binding protein
MAAPVELLRNVSLFVDLTDEELDSIAALSHRKRFGAREAIVRQADPGGEMFVIVSGHLKVVSSDPEGRDTALSIMGPGEVFGEVTLLDGGPRSATIIALEPSELLSIRRDAFVRFLETSPGTSIKLLSVLSDRLRRLTERAEDIAFLRVGGRLAKRVSQLADDYGERRADGSVRISFKLSQQEMGDLVGATRESANKQVRHWEQAGIVSQQSGHLIVHDLERLRELGES